MTLREARINTPLHLQEWAHQISLEDRKRLAHTLRFDSNPAEFNALMAELRERYDFIPANPAAESA